MIGIRFLIKEIPTKIDDTVCKCVVQETHYGSSYESTHAICDSKFIMIYHYTLAEINVIIIVIVII